MVMMYGGNATFFPDHARSRRRFGTDLHQQSYSMSRQVSIWMGDHRQVGEPSQYATSHPGQHSLAITP